MGGPGASRCAMVSAALVLALVGCLVSAVAFAQTTISISPLGRDTATRIDRYQVVIRPGGTLWELAITYLPTFALEHGDARVLDLVEMGWHLQYPDRASGDVQPGDTFVLELPTGTFVAKSVRRQGERVVSESFAGDELTTYPREPSVVWRLRRADTPDKVEVLINASQGSPIEAAKVAYDVPSPDFVQVRVIRGAFQDKTATIVVDLNRRYLDEFRGVRDKATRTENVSNGQKAYWFDPNDSSVPFVRVDDGIGDETDPANFARLFRTVYHRDGTVRRYLVTESGDSLASLQRPDNVGWSAILPAWREWQDGQAESLPPFAPALNAAGTLLPGRILIISHRPRFAPSTPRPTPVAGSGVDCLGLPLGMIVAGFVAYSRLRPT